MAQNNEDNVISVLELRKFKILSDIKNQTNFTEENSDIIDALAFAIETATMIDANLMDKTFQRFRNGEEPYPCYNAVCEEHLSAENRFNFCNLGHHCFDCPFQMLDFPPSSLDYEEGIMPSHQKALDLLVEHGLLKEAE